jgi:S13-like H2TH domain
MAVPAMTLDQRRAALRKAAEARQARAKLRDGLRSGNLTLATVFELVDRGLKATSATRIGYLLASLPNHDIARVEEILTKLAISPDRRAGGLGPRQRAALLAEVAKSPVRQQETQQRPEPVRNPTFQAQSRVQGR